MQPFVQRQTPYESFCRRKSLKTSNGPKYHSDKMHGVNDSDRVEVGLFVSNGDSQRPPSRLTKAAPPALTLNQENNPPDVNLLTEFAVIATGPQSPLVQNAPDDKYSPPPNLVDPNQALGRFHLEALLSEEIADCLPESSPGHEHQPNESLAYSTACTSTFTDVDSTAVLALSNMAKDREAHSHRRSKLLLSVSSCLSSSLKRKAPPQQLTKRPMNAFMIFAKRYRLEITQAHPGRDNRAISVILGDKWKAMKQEDRREYIQQAKLLAEEHKRINPDCWKRKRSSHVQGPSKISSCRRL